MKNNQQQQPKPEKSEYDREVEYELEGFMAGAAASAVTCYIYRVGSAGEDDKFLDVAQASNVTEQMLQDEYGEGKYRLRYRSRKKDGKFTFEGTRTVNIAHNPRKAREKLAADRANGTNGQHFDNNNFNERLILALIAAQKPAPAFDMVGLAALITAVTGNGKGQTDIGAIVTAFTQLKAAADPKDVKAELRDALELARSLVPGAPAPGAAGAGDGELDTSWPGIIKGVLQTFTGPRRPPAAGGRVIPASVAGDEEFEDDPAGQDPGATMQQWLMGQLQFLKSKAISKKPVDFWIRYTIDNAEEAGNQAIFEALRGGATFEHLLMFDPEIATTPALRVWFQQFYDGLKQSANAAAPPAYPWIVGNTPNATDNAGGGTPGQSATSSAVPGSDPAKPAGN